MKKLFVDTSFLVAFCNMNDKNHTDLKYFRNIFRHKFRELFFQFCKIANLKSTIIILFLSPLFSLNSVFKTPKLSLTVEFNTTSKIM